MCIDSPFLLVVRNICAHTFGDQSDSNFTGTKNCSLLLILSLSPAPPSIDTHPVSVAADEWDQVNMTCRIFGSPPMLVQWMRVGGASLSSTTTQLEPVEIDTYLVRDGNLVHGGWFYVCDSMWIGNSKCTRFCAFDLFILMNRVVWIGAHLIIYVSRM